MQSFGIFANLQYCCENEECWNWCFALTSFNIKIINKNATTNNSIMANGKQVNKNTTTISTGANVYIHWCYRTGVY